MDYTPSKMTADQAARFVSLKLEQLPQRGFAAVLRQIIFNPENKVDWDTIAGLIHSEMPETQGIDTRLASVLPQHTGG